MAEVRLREVDRFNRAAQSPYDISLR